MLGIRLDVALKSSLYSALKDLWQRGGPESLPPYMFISRETGARTCFVKVSQPVSHKIRDILTYLR